MAKAANLHPGARHTILRGMLAGEAVTIVDATPFKDDDPYGRQRKVTTTGPDGHTLYILPRLLSSRPVEEETVVVPSAPVSTPAIPVAEAPTSVLPQIMDRTGNHIREVKPITDPMDPRLDHLRPSKPKCRRYKPRSWTTASWTSTCCSSSPTTSTGRRTRATPPTSC